MKIEKIPTAAEALSSIDEALRDNRTDSTIRGQIERNYEEIKIAKKFFTEKIDNDRIIRIMSILESLAGWTLSHREKVGAFQLFVDISILNIHLNVTYANYYR